jgi:hypothetical protein
MPQKAKENLDEAEHSMPSDCGREQIGGANETFGDLYRIMLMRSDFPEHE